MHIKSRRMIIFCLRFDPNRPKPVSTKKKGTKKATKADVIRAFKSFGEALKKLEAVCLSAV